jgi:hypothetical protein
MRLMRLCFVAMALVMALLATPAALASTRAPQPLVVVRQYLQALDRHNGPAVCRTFSAQLRAFEVANDSPPSGRRRTCAVTVRAHFRDYYSDHRWASARIVGAARTTLDAVRGIALVRMTLAHRYVCAGPGTADEPCHADIKRRPERIYLLRGGGGWKILKPGLVYRASEIDSASGDESIYYPPGDVSTIATPPVIPAPNFACPPSRAAVADRAGDVENFNNAGPFTVNAPWLDITRIAVSRINRHTLCFALTLAAPPHADTDYGFGIMHELRGGGEGTSFGLAIDGVGHSHALDADRGRLGSPSGAAALPRYGLVGNRLEFAVAAPRKFTSGLSLQVQASSDSLQTDEPLLSHPLNAGDLIAPDHGCLKFPTGGISLAGICSNEPGP